MTLREALRIQEAHLKAYGSDLTTEQEKRLRDLVADNTLVFPDDDMDYPWTMKRINELVPRGDQIKYVAQQIADGTYKSS